MTELSANTLYIGAIQDVTNGLYRTLSGGKTKFILKKYSNSFVLYRGSVDPKRVYKDIKKLLERDDDRYFDINLVYSPRENAEGIEAWYDGEFSNDFSAISKIRECGTNCEDNDLAYGLYITTGLYEFTNLWPKKKDIVDLGDYIILKKNNIPCAFLLNIESQIIGGDQNAYAITDNGDVIFGNGIISDLKKEI